MTPTPPTPTSVEVLWPPPWARSVAFMVGLGLMCYEAVIDHSAHLIVYGPGFLLTGLPVARGLEGLLDRLTGGGKSRGESS